jgi:aminoglycoside 3-N-acetyltransferase
MTIRLEELVSGWHKVGLEQVPIVVHASLASLGFVEGGAGTLLVSLLEVFPVIIAPAFTYKTMLTPHVGPDGNGMVYGSSPDQNRMAEFYNADMPADPLMGILPETLRNHPEARRSTHPILSFTGVNADKYIAAQTLQEPLAPLRSMADEDGWVLLIGVDHTVNTSIHVAERMAGRKTFIRWALTPVGVVECPGFPPCSAGFNAIAPELERFSRRVQVGEAMITAVPMKMVLLKAITCIHNDPLALLCQERGCERCEAIRDSVGQKEDS